MTELEAVLADCIDVWMNGQDPTPILKRHPSVADEVRQLMQVAQAVRRSVPPVSLRQHGEGRPWPRFSF